MDVEVGVKPGLGVKVGEEVELVEKVELEVGCKVEGKR